MPPRRASNTPTPTGRLSARRWLWYNFAVPRNPALVPLSCLAAVSVGCSEWPRFANPPPEDLAPPSGEVTLVEVATEDEGEFPADPRALIATTPRPVGGAYSGLVWRGALGWAGAASGAEDFECGVAISTSYQGDVDFFSFTHQGGALCVTVVPGLDGDPAGECGAEAREPLWEMPLFKYDEQDACPTGPWFNETTRDQNTGVEFPEAYGLDRRALFFPRLDAGTYTVFLAGVCGTYLGAEPDACPDRAGTPNSLPCVPYDFAVAVVPTQEACDKVHDDLEEARR